MHTHVAPPPGRLSAEEFLEFAAEPPREERWELMDGEPFMMMSPASVPHQMIGRMHEHLRQMAFPDIPRF